MHERRRALGLEAEHAAARAPSSLEALPVGGDVAGVADRDAQRVESPPSSSTSSNAAVFWPSSRNALTELTSAIGWRVGELAHELERLVEVAAQRDTRAPCISAWASLPVAILPSGTITAPRSPARAA